MRVTESTGWSQGVGRKIFTLFSARLVAQMVGICWFLGIARVFDSGELGILAAGLVTFATVSVVGDRGITWSIAREVTGHDDRAWSFYVQGMRRRAVSAALVGGLVLAVAAPLVDRRVYLAMGLGVVLAMAAGASEVGMATLRALGRIGPESLALPLERFAFLALASTVVAFGRGPNVVLLVYLSTNVATAIVVFIRIHRDLRPLAESGNITLWGAETRRVGVAFAVLALGPRVNGLVLVLLADRLEVADYSVGSRPVEQLALILFSFSTALLPLLCNDHLEGRDPSERARPIATGIAVVASPGMIWVVVRPEPIIDFMYGAGRYPGAPTVLALVAVVSVTWSLRGLAGLVMVARDEAGSLARTSAWGLVVNFALVVPLAIAYGATGAAIALVVTDVAISIVLIQRSGLIRPELVTRKIRRAGAFGVGAGLTAAMVPFVLGIIVVFVGTVVVLLQVLDAQKATAITGQARCT